MERYFSVSGGGHSIRCKLYYSQDPRSVRHMVLFCHGFGGHKDNGAAEKFAQRLLSKHKNVAMVTFDLPCHGEDVKKKLTLSDCQAYLQQVVSFLKEKYPLEDLYCYATSFGGYLILKYISELGNPFRKIALRCPAVDMYGVLSGNILSAAEQALLRKGKAVPVGFDRKVPVSSDFLEELKKNDIRTRDYLDYAEDILILHGTADEIAPFEASHHFSEDRLIELIAVEGADHRFRAPGTMEQAIKASLAFFELE